MRYYVYMCPVQKDFQQKLYEVAEGQAGYFTAKQAELAGFAKKNHAYHVKTGNWLRVERGIYRLAQYPVTDDAHYVVWSLWSRSRDDDKPQGVLSHETALGLHELSDVNPSKIHLSVPKNFRRSRTTPKTLVLHFDDVRASDTVARHGFRVTKPLRTLIDVASEGKLSREFIEQALKQALKRGLISRKELRDAPMNKKAKQILFEILVDSAA